jgi:hypothetical protein
MPDMNYPAIYFLTEKPLDSVHGVVNQVDAGVVHESTDYIKI